ncbi:hypothetical protein HPP92_009909 [Vanilla planifolia]|uniref:Uncharacterized protein n=1 Tax=Vanilla planifolia TaxID=51239 RepID=A0A835V2Y6_VANPL|nr:hypothetical protein HPP92_009909 [Vanilla planifolia]
MDGSSTDDNGIGGMPSPKEGISAGQRCQSVDSLAEWRSSEHLPPHLFSGTRMMMMAVGPNPPSCMGNLFGRLKIFHRLTSVNCEAMHLKLVFTSAYQPLLAIIISRFIAQVEKPNIEWPKSLQRIPPNMSRHLSTEYFSEDFVSHFLHILVPLTLRPVSLHLFSEREKDDLAQLVGTMVTYSLTYKNARDENLQVPDKPGSTFDVHDYKPEHLGLSLAMKQILLHEIEKQKILRESSGRSSSLTNQNVNHSQTSNVSNSELLLEVDTSNSVYDQGSGKPIVTNLKKQVGGDNISSSKLKGISNTIKATAKSMKPRPSTDFFKRFRVGSNIDLKNAADNLQKIATAERDSRPFLFKYNEGFTNAVKRPVKVRELL